MPTPQAEHVDAKNYSRTCLYLTSCCSYLPEPDDALVLNIAHSIYMTQVGDMRVVLSFLRLGAQGGQT